MKTQFWTSCLFITFFILNGQSVVAQNLIPNPSFELWDGTTGPNPNTLGGLDNWYNANGTADHHHTSITGNNLTGLEDCPLGQGNTDCGVPVEGEAVMGCWKGNGNDGTREWAAVQLTQPMEAGVCYKVSFWVQNKEDNPNSLFETNQWGIFFSETMIPTFGVNVIDYTSKLDQIVMTEEVVGGSEWHFYEFDFYANDPYQYAYIGYQGNVSTSTYVAANPDFLLGFYAWFDVLSVIRLTPPEMTITEDVSICKGDSILISATSNYEVLWSHLNSDATTFWASPQETTTYYAKTQDSTECAILDSIVVTINPDVIVDYPTTESICAGSNPFILDTNGNDGTWSGAGIIDANTSLFNPTLAGVGVHEVFYESNNDCSENFNLIVDVLDAPLVDFEPDISSGCAPAEISFADLSPPNGVTYYWDFGNGMTSSASGSASTIYDDFGDYDVSLTVEYSEHCAATFTQTNLIQVGEVPNANFSYSPSQITNLNPLAQFDNTSSQNASSVLWDFGDGNFSTKPNPTYEYTAPGIYETQLTVTSPEGCQDSISQLITVTNEVILYAPNVFSPNNDGRNDVFEITPIGLVENYQITIFNRWGSTVFHSNNINESWDGYVKGKLPEIGVYVYLIEYQFADFVNSGFQKGKLSGNVMILK